MTENLNKIFKGALIAGAGAVLAYVTQQVSDQDLGEWSPVIGAAWAVVTNAVRKFLPDLTNNVKGLLK